MSNDRIPEIENDQMTLTKWPRLSRDIFGEIRTCQVNNQIMFVGKDVATALGYAKSRNALTAHVDDEDKKDALIQGPLVTEGQAPCDRHHVT